MAFVLWLINPGYIMILINTRTGIHMLVTAFALQVIGFFVIRKIIRIQI